MSKILKRAKASLKLLEASRIGKAHDKAKQRLKEAPLIGKLRNLGFARQEEFNELRARVEALEAALGTKQARPTFIQVANGEAAPEN